MPLYSIPVAGCARGSSRSVYLPGKAVPKLPAGRRPSRPSIPRQVAAAANATKVAEILQSDTFREALNPLRAECEADQEGTGFKVIVVSRAFEGKTAKRREKLVRQADQNAFALAWQGLADVYKTAVLRAELVTALQEDEPEGVTIMAITPSESAAMLKKWC